MDEGILLMIVGFGYWHNITLISRAFLLFIIRRLRIEENKRGLDNVTRGGILCIIQISQFYQAKKIH